MLASPELVSPRTRVKFNAHWSFHKGEAAGAQVPDFDDSAWRPLNLPHDWGIEGPFDQNLPGETGKLPWTGAGWYRKSFTVPADAAGRRFVLEIEGAMANSTVWLNGQEVGGWPNGYSSYELDLTAHLRLGDENTLAVRLENLPESSRWYPGAGIYRNVWLLTTGPVHVAQWGTQVTAEVRDRLAAVAVATTLRNEESAVKCARLSSRVLDAAGAEVAVENVEFELAPGADTVQKSELIIAQPRLWSLTDPHLYTLVTEVWDGDELLDRYETPFGIRTIHWDKEQGFLLNGTRVPLQGVCLHSDLGALGMAISRRAIERQLEILREMGVNAIRTAHNPPAPDLLDLCDGMGFLVIDEFTDAWTLPKKPNDYSRLFADWAEPDLRAMIRRDRNHPCIIIWSVGNELPEQWQGHDVARFLSDIAHSEDASRLTTTGNDRVESGYNGFQTTVDVFGYNYKPHQYAPFRAANPDIPLYGSETASTISSRGEYMFPVSEDPDEGKADFQVSSYDLYAPGWASVPEKEFIGQDDNPFVSGEFVWTGFDYLGEPTPYNSDLTVLTNFHTPEAKAKAEQELAELGRIPVPSRSSYFGIVDLAGFPKDRFYLYQARWRPDLRMAHLLPHWNWPERVGLVTPVHLYTSGDEAELFLNGQSLGRRVKGPGEYRLRWDEVVYEPGELRAVVTKAGKLWAEDTVVTTGPAATIRLESDCPAFTEGGPDLAFITATVVDEAGHMVPRACPWLRFEVSGPGEIVATDNGDATDHTAFPSHERRAYNGLALCIVRPLAVADGRVVVRTFAEGLAMGEVRIGAPLTRDGL